jgi:hypothetical protein
LWRRKKLCGGVDGELDGCLWKNRYLYEGVDFRKLLGPLDEMGLDLDLLYAGVVLRRERKKS